MRTLFRIFGKAGRAFADDGCIDLAAGLAYYALFSIFPLVLGLVTITGVVFRSSEVSIQGRLLRVVGELAPGSEGFMAVNLEAIASAGQALGLLSALALIWSGSAFFHAAQRAINVVWGVEKHRSYWGQRMVAFGIMALLGAVQGALVVSAVLVEIVQKMDV